jgi:hypothetical protein
MDEITGQAAPGAVETSASASWLRAIVFAFLGLIVAVFCLLIPGLHFILGPLGPLIGGMVAANQCRGGLSSVIVISSVMSMTLGVLAAALSGMFLGEETSSGLAKAAPFIVFFYTGLMSFIGGLIGMVMGSRSETAG